MPGRRQRTTSTWSASKGRVGDNGSVTCTAEMDRLDVCCSQVAAGRAAVVIIKGEAGIGKTHLLQNLRRRLSAWLVGVADGDPAESRLPFGRLSQLMSTFPRFTTGPGLGASLPGTQSDPLIVGSELLHSIGELPSTAPVAPLIDDAGWADQQSLQALSFALRRLEADRG